MDIKAIIMRAKRTGVAPRDIAYILEIDYDFVQEILQVNGLWYNKNPGRMPNSYYTERISEGYSVMDMAKELNCTRAAIYSNLHRRGISMDAYRPT